MGAKLEPRASRARKFTEEQSVKQKNHQPHTLLASNCEMYELHLPLSRGSPDNRLVTSGCSYYVLFKWE